MRKYITLFITFLIASIGIQSQEYEYKKGDLNGIGKWYLGREIAYVMGYQGISWLERSTRQKEEDTEQLIKNLEIQPTDVIADIGAGSGYHVFKMAPLANEGEIIAVDIQEEMLQAIFLKPDYETYGNISLVKGSSTQINVEENSVNKILMVDVYHEFEFPKEMLASMRKALKENGKIYLIEYRMEDDSVPIKRLHKISEKQAVKEFNANGFQLEKNIRNLPWQHCMIFTKTN